MKKGMVYRHVMSVVSEEWMISRIDDKHHNYFTEQKTTVTVTSTSVVFKDGSKGLVRKKKKASTNKAA